MDKAAKIFIAGHKGLVGSALVRKFQAEGFTQLITRSKAELDLTHQQAVDDFFASEQPEYVIVAAAKVGGIYANSHFPADFITTNLGIELNVMNSAYKHGVKRLIFLASSCIYPRDCQQPMHEDALLTGSIEPTNRSYAVAKIAGVELCRAYNAQHQTKFLTVIPAGLYGPDDNFDLNNSHIIPAQIRKFYEATRDNLPTIEAWGTGSPIREFMHVDDCADACLNLLTLSNDKFNPLVDPAKVPLLNVGSGKEYTIKELVESIREISGYQGELVWNTDKPDGMPRKLVDSSLLHELLEWRPSISLKEGLQEVYEHYQKQPLA